MAEPPGEDPDVLRRKAQARVLSMLASGEDDLHAAACLRGGLLPDLLREAGGWEPRLWTDAVSAVVLYTRAAADRLAQTVPEIALEMADRLCLELSVDPQSTDRPGSRWSSLCRATRSRPPQILHPADRIRSTSQDTSGARAGAVPERTDPKPDPEPGTAGARGSWQEVRRWPKDSPVAARTVLESGQHRPAEASREHDI